MPDIKRALLVPCMIAMALTLGSASCAREPQDFETIRHTVFTQAWTIIGTNYYDRSMNGFDWNAVRRTYEPKVIDAKNSIDLYWKVLRPMTGLLETSHVLANSPSAPRARAADAQPQAAGRRLNPESCGGLLISFGPRGLRSRITSVDSDSPLYAEGVRAGWRLLGATALDEDSGLPRALALISTDGSETEIDLTKIAGIDRALVLRDFESVNKLRIGGATPATESNMDSLGISITAGRNATMPFVVDVLPGTEAERSGIEPGSTFIEWQSKQAGGGEILFIGKFNSPGGKTYSASFKFRLCDLPDRAANVLHGGILHLRFDAFKPDVVPWLDEQIRTNPRAIILDLRRNGGGNAQAMLDVLGRFLSAGTRIGNVISADRDEPLAAGAASHVFRGPLAVLLGPLSASASEVSASALRFHERARLYGQHTGGDVLLASSFQLADGGIVQVATADIRGADGRRLEDEGVKVDKEVRPTLAAIRASRDLVLEAAQTDLTQAIN